MSSGLEPPSVAVENQNSSQRKKRITELEVQAISEGILLFGDAAEVSLVPTITCCWTRIGKQRFILTPGVRASEWWNWGAVDPITGRTVHIVHRRRNNVGFQRLLAAISRAYDLPAHPARQVILYVDNDRTHTNEAVRQLLEKHDQIQIEWLPSYSPDLNAQEDVWQHMRRRVTHDHYFHLMDALREAVQQFHQRLEEEPKTVPRLLTKWAELTLGLRNIIRLDLFCPNTRSRILFSN